jgi:hypothetical protein
MTHRWYVPILSVVVLASLVQGQPTWGLDRGSVLVGGNASYYEASGELQSFSTKKFWDLLPYAYYCVSPNVALGGALLLSTETRSGYESETFAGVGPGVMAFMADSSSTVYPFVGLNLYYAYLNQENLGSSSGNLRTLHGYAFELSLGGTYMLNKYVGITGMFYYQGQQLSENGDWKGGKRYGYRIGLTGFIF